MKTFLFAAAASILVAGSISGSAGAHELRAPRSERVHDYMALSQGSLRGLDRPDPMILRGPTNDPTSTATGGPVGGIY